jgi:hypothetical protein
LNGELTRHHTRLSIATHSVAMLYSKNATSDAVKKVELTAATLYSTVSKGIGGGVSTGFSFGDRAFFESKPRPVSFEFEEEKEALRSAIGNLVDAASIDLTPNLPAKPAEGGADAGYKA